MNAAMDSNFRYYDCSQIVDGITGEEQDNLTIMVAVPKIDLSDAENRQQNLDAILKIVEEQYRKEVDSFKCEEYTGL